MSCKIWSTPYGPITPSPSSSTRTSGAAPPMPSPTAVATGSLRWAMRPFAIGTMSRPVVATAPASVNEAEATAPPATIARTSRWRAAPVSLAAATRSPRSVRPRTRAAAA